MTKDSQVAQQLPHVLHEYGWSPVKVKEVRGAYRVQTEQDVFALKPVNNTDQHLSFLNTINETLRKQDYAHVLPWVRTKYGDPYYVGQQMVFYATPWYGREWTPDQDVSEEQLVQSLAELHRLTFDEAQREDTTVSDELSKTVTKWEERVGRIDALTEVAEKRKFSSPFDVAFLSHVAELKKACAFADKGIRRMLNRAETYPFRQVMSHRRVHRHNVVCKKGAWKWVDFDHGGYHTPVWDLALFLQRFVRVERNDAQTLVRWLAVYERIFPLKAREKQLLGLLLLYPGGVYQYLQRYYNEKRQHDEMYYVEQLEAALQRFKLLKKFVKQSWPRLKNQDKAKSH